MGEINVAQTSAPGEFHSRECMGSSFPLIQTFLKLFSLQSSLFVWFYFFVRHNPYNIPPPPPRSLSSSSSSPSLSSPPPPPPPSSTSSSLSSSTSSTSSTSSSLSSSTSSSSSSESQLSPPKLLPLTYAVTTTTYLLWSMSHLSYHYLHILKVLLRSCRSSASGLF